MNLTQQVAETLGKAIISGEYGEHKPIPSEAILCQQFEVSRSAAREAVKSLAAKGLITSRARQGIKILPETEWSLFDADVLRWIRDSNPSLNLLREFTELRVAIEPEAAMLAAEHQNENMIMLVGQALDRMNKADSGLDDPLESDIAFHLSILNASENRFFMQLGRIIDTTLRISLRFINIHAGGHSDNHNKQQKIYDAIVLGDAKLAAKHMNELMTTELSTINSTLKEQASF